MKNILTLLLVGFCLQSSFAGGGWLKKKGEGYFKFGQGMIFGSNYYQPDGTITDIISTNYYETYFYGEYGISKRFTTIGYLPVFARVTKNSLVDQNGDVIAEGDQLSSLGDFMFALKYGILTEKRIVWSAQLNLKLPTGVNSGGETELLQTGDGAFSQMLQTDVSTTFGDFYL